MKGLPLHQVIAESINYGFEWYNDAEGSEFWSKVYEHFISNEIRPLPQLPT